METSSNDPATSLAGSAQLIGQLPGKVFFPSDENYDLARAGCPPTRSSDKTQERVTVVAFRCSLLLNR